jgi:hypothetical protein
MAWGIFLIGAGSIWFMEQMIAGFNVEGAIPLLAGAVLLGLNAVRASVNIPVRYFTVGLGVVLTLVGIADLAEAYFPFSQLPVVPLALIIIGAMLLYGAIRKPRGDEVV